MFDTVFKKYGFPFGVLACFVVLLFVYVCLLRGTITGPILPKKELIVKAEVEVPHLKGGGTALNNQPNVNEIYVNYGKPVIGNAERWAGAKYFEAKPNKIDAAGSLTEDELNKNYAVSGTMMWDSENLYVGAIIGDPNKRIAINTAKINDTDEDLPTARTGSCIEIGIFNRNQSPLPTATSLTPPTVTVTPSAGKTNQDKVTKKLAFLTFCKLDENNRACLIVRKVDSALPATAPFTTTYSARVFLHDGVEGFKGTFSYPKNDDKHCYFEAVIPWKILVGQDASLPYNSFKTSWMIRLVDPRQSDRSGTLVELVSPGSEIANPGAWADTSKWGTAKVEGGPGR